VQVQPWPQPVLPLITARIGQSRGERGYAGVTGEPIYSCNTIVACFDCTGYNWTVLCIG